MSDPFSMIPPGRQLSDYATGIGQSRASDPVAFSATLVDVKLIRTRKCVQFLFEEDVSKLPPNIVENLGGLAALANGKIHCAIARLNSDGAAAPKQSLNTPLKTVSTEGAARNSLPQRAALLCNDPQFRLFLEQWPSTKQMLPRGCHVNTGEAAAMVVRTFCRVDSRSEIIAGTEAGDRWENLHSQFVVWKHADRYVEAPRIQQENQA